MSFFSAISARVPPGYMLSSYIPSSCILCNGLVGGLKPLCTGCENDLPWNNSACVRCAMPMHDTGQVCGQCLQEPPVFQRALSAFRYENPVANLLNRYKHSGKLLCGYWLAHHLADVGAAHYRAAQIPLPDCVMPVPLHWRRLRRRGFDQGLEIGKVLARQLRLPLVTSLRRQHHTDSQQDLGREQRQCNLAGAFRLAYPLRYGSVALVDDVLTTGSTVTSITNLLRQQGVTDVHVWTIARTL
jgi:ComF family protein